MENFYSSSLATTIQLISAGLQGGSIKLRGVVSTDSAEEDAKADALYLKTLISELQVAVKALE